MASDFREWLACPDCAETGDVSVLAHGTEIVLECYECGRIAEFVLDDDFPLGGARLADDDTDPSRRVSD